MSMGHNSATIKKDINSHYNRFEYALWPFPDFYQLRLYLTVIIKLKLFVFGIDCYVDEG